MQASPRSPRAAASCRACVPPRPTRPRTLPGSAQPARASERQPVRRCSAGRARGWSAAPADPRRRPPAVDRPPQPPRRAPTPAPGRWRSRARSRMRAGPRHRWETRPRRAPARQPETHGLRGRRRFPVRSSRDGAGPRSDSTSAPGQQSDERSDVAASRCRDVVSAPETRDGVLGPAPACASSEATSVQVTPRPARARCDGRLECTSALAQGSGAPLLRRGPRRPVSQSVGPRARLLSP